MSAHTVERCADCHKPGHLHCLDVNNDEHAALDIALQGPRTPVVDTWVTWPQTPMAHRLLRTSPHTIRTQCGSNVAKTVIDLAARHQPRCTDCTNQTTRNDRRRAAITTARGALITMRSAVGLVTVLVCALTMSVTTARAATPHPPAPPPAQVSDTGTVVKVTDGDTVHVATTHGALDVRVLGIDTPETVKPRTPVQCGGPQASAFAHQTLDGKAVTLVPDPLQGNVDRYGRALRYVRLAGVGDYSLAVVRAGWARVYTYGAVRVNEYPDLEAAQKAAVAAKRGLWGICPNPTPGD